MTEITARQVLLSFIIFGTIITAGFSMLSQSVNTSDYDSNFTKINTTLNKFGTINDNVNEIEASVNPQDQPASGVLGILNTLIENTVGVFKLLWNTFDVMTDLLSDLSEGVLGFPIPTWFTALITTSLIVIIGFALMSAWFKWRI